MTDYTDVFTRATGAHVTATPEQWARTMLGNVPGPAQRLIWGGLLGLHLSRGYSPETVAGWRIADRGPDWIGLETASWFLSAEIVIRATSDDLSMRTSVHYDKWPAKIIWPPLSAVHRAIVPRLLESAVKRKRS